MDLAAPDGTSHGGVRGPHSQRPCRNFAHGACRWGSSCRFAHNEKVSQVCWYFQRGFCFHGDKCRYQHPQSPFPLEWSRCHSEPHLALLGPRRGLTRRSSEPTYLPSAAVGWSLGPAWWGTEPSPGSPANKAEEVGGSSWRPLFLSSADRDHSYPQESQPKSNLAEELVVPLQSLDLEGEQESQDVVCGICMEKVWGKPEAERVFGILPNCPHAYCLGCLRTWRMNRQDFSLNIVKACPQCRVHSSYVIPHKFWVSKGPQKEQLIQSFKARTSQIRCRFFMRGNGRCPFKSDCIYLHQLPIKASIARPAWPESAQLASGSEALSPAAFPGASEPEDNVVFTDYALAMAFWGSELLLDPNSSYHGLL